MGKTSTSFTIDGNLLKEIKKDAKKQDRSKSSIVNKILQEHYNENKSLG